MEFSIVIHFSNCSFPGIGAYIEITKGNTYFIAFELSKVARYKNIEILEILDMFLYNGFQLSWLLHGLHTDHQLAWWVKELHTDHQLTWWVQ